MGVQTQILPTDPTDAVAKLKRIRAEALRRKAVLLEREACMVSLVTFVRMVWSNVLFPGKEMTWNWHLDIICEMLEAVFKGELKRLLINVPPRSSKTTIISVCYQIWVWLHDPSHQFLCAAHSGKKARADAVKARNIMRSTWFQERFGDIFKWSLDENAKDRYSNDKGGHRLSYGMTTAIAGENADCLVGDTIVTTQDGPMRIDALCAMANPPKVLAFDHHHKHMDWCRVVASRKIASRPVMEIKTESGRKIRGTADHRVYVRHRDYVAIDDVNPGDYLHAVSDGPVREHTWDAVKSISEISGAHDVFDIQVEGHHNFIANGLLVHNCILIDDPHDPDNVNSDSERSRVLDNYDDSFSQRLNNPAEGAIIIVMQRLHQNDLCGHVLANAEVGEWVHLMFAQEYEPNHPYLSDICRLFDPRTKAGELLWPERFPESYLRKRRKTMTALGYSGQHQQRPTPASGSILKKQWWRVWPTDMPMPEMEFVLHSWDTAFSGEDLKNNARSAMISLGIFWNEKRHRFCIMLLRGYAKHLEYPDLRRMGKKLTRKDNPDMVLVEKKASGTSFIQDLHRAGVPAVKYNPDRDKIARAYAVQAILESGQLYYPFGKRWAEEVIEECGAFPYGVFKDYADCLTQGLLRIRDMEEFSHPDDVSDDEDEDERSRRKPFGGEDDDFSDDNPAYG